MDLDAEVDRLYGLPLDEFVHERDELARNLNRAGDREAGGRVKALRKPTVGAWALNQAVRRRRAETEALLATGERLREAHEQLLAGGDQATLREAMDQERALTSALADCAEALASETGKSGPALRDRVRSTLHAAAVDEEAREELARGRFVREREAVGLGPFGAGAAPAPAKGGAAARRAAKGGGAGAAPAPAKGGGAAAGRSAPKGKRSAAKAERGGAKAASRASSPPAPDPRLAEAERALADTREAHARAEAEHAASAASTKAARAALEQAEVAEREARREMRELEREVAKQDRKAQRLRPKR
ncbi:MAG: hypothetical protein QOK00_420 [Thermoleophilaceae bacterium]|nr:hypothetical protein [Thermoleophilaceae bacterium]